VANKIRVVCTAAALVPLALLAACGSSGTSTTAASSSASSAASAGGVVSLTETGSTLMFPLFGAWQTEYNKTVTNVNLTTAGTGSGTGIADAASGIVNMGASDAYLSSAEMSQNHNLLNIPLAVSSAMVSYNLPGLKGHLKLSGTVLAQIYSGKITKWNDPAIAKINPGVKLPSMNIVTLHRSDSSGTTFIYASYLNAQDPAGWPAAQVGTTVSWPKAPGALAELGNGGMVSGCAATKGCIAYIGTSYLTQTTAARLGEAELANKAGKYTLPTSPAVQAALSQFAPNTPANEAQALINTSNPKGYPIINYEYVVVNKKQSSAAVASALKAFLNWTITTGNSATFLGPVNFESLPASVKALTQKQISSISG
jgi:phosphate transport system substrate-binding protein